MKIVLYIAVFISGLVSLAVEMTASRLLGNFFGSSNLVWACIIGLILIYLTVGYFVGGRWADHSPNYLTFFRILAWSGFLVVLVAPISRPILRLAANAFDELSLGILLGSFLAVIILFIAPITLLGASSPFAIRLAARETAQIGSISGKIYAISTLGSFIGTFLPVLILIPTIGTYRSFIFFGGILVLYALFGLVYCCSLKKMLSLVWMPVIIVVLYIFGLPGADKNTAGMIFEAESGYNYIQVLNNGGYTLLRLNEGQGVHSIYKPDELAFYGPWDQVLNAPFFNPPVVELTDIKRIGIIGLAAGTAARQALSVFPNLEVDGYEIDPLIVETGKKYFGMDLPKLNVYVTDGRWGLEHSHKSYQVISIDAYRPPYIPYHLTTREFFRSVADHLTETGVVVINVGSPPDDRRLLTAICSTMKSVFPSLFTVEIPNTFNLMVFATKQPSDSKNLLLNYANLTQKGPLPTVLDSALKSAISNVKPVAELPEEDAFTDDKAPVEWIINSMVFNFVMSGETENLK